MSTSTAVSPSKRALELPVLKPDVIEKWNSYDDQTKKQLATEMIGCEEQVTTLIKLVTSTILWEVLDAPDNNYINPSMNENLPIADNECK